jgi:hypothetical protein
LRDKAIWDKGLRGIGSKFHNLSYEFLRHKW